MSDARQAIFDRIRQSTRRVASDQDSQTLISRRLADHPRGPIPTPVENLMEHFVEKALATSASVATIDSIAVAGDAISSYLAEHNLSHKVTVAPAPLLDQIKWPDLMEIERRTAQAQDITSVSLAYAGIAETATLALLSCRETPTLLNFLPDNNICILQRSDLLGQMEDVWDRMRCEQRAMPRMLNFITGPSRTADVEQTIQLGAHGPRRLHIIIITA